jgi:hypothetical protein
MVNRLWDGRYGVRVLVRAKEFSLLQSVQIGTGAYLASDSKGTAGSFTGDKAAGFLKLTTFLHIMLASCRVDTFAFLTSQIKSCLRYITISCILSTCISTNVPSSFFCCCADLLLLWAENFYTTWRLHDTLKIFYNIHNKKIYNKNWKIPAAQHQFSVRGSISVTAQMVIGAA